MENNNVYFNYMNTPQRCGYGQYIRQPMKVEQQQTASEKFCEKCKQLASSSNFFAVGLLLQLLAYALELFTIIDPAWTQELSKSSYYKSFLQHNLIAAKFLMMLGLIFLACFQIYLPDSGRLSRGFRAGSKLFMSAVQINLFSVALQLMQFSVTKKLLEQRWWLKYMESTTEWSLIFVSNLLHSLSSFLYGMSLQYLEICKEENESETQKNHLSICCTFGSFMNIMAAIHGNMKCIIWGLEFLIILTNIGKLYIVFHIISILCTLVWSFSFKNVLKHMYIEDTLEI